MWQPRRRRAARQRNGRRRFHGGVHDGYGAYTADDTRDPVGADSTTRVVRGGSTFQVADQAQVTAREGHTDAEPVPWRGFRLVKPRD